MSETMRELVGYTVRPDLSNFLNLLICLVQCHLFILIKNIGKKLRKAMDF